MTMQSNSKLNKEFMLLAQQRIDYNEKIIEINSKLNNIINKILINNNKYSSITEFIKLNNLDESDLKIDETVLDSFDE